MHASRIRLECLKLAVELCKTASAFHDHARVMELAKQFEEYCCGPVLVPGTPEIADKRPGAMAKPSKKDMAKYLA